MLNEFPYDVFLSHSAKDKAVVRPLAERLLQVGLKVWFDEWVLKPGDSILAKIEAGRASGQRLYVQLKSGDSPSPALRAPSPPLGERDGVRGPITGSSRLIL